MSVKVLDRDKQCEGLCPIDDSCLGCVVYWKSMIEQGYYEVGVGWTDKSQKEWLQ